MTFDPQRPRYCLNFNGKDYELIGTMELIEQIEYALKRNIVDICTSCLDMPTYDFIRVFGAVLNHSGYKISQEELKKVIWEEIGAEDLTMLRLHVFAYIKICIAKPNQRVEVAQKMGELLKPAEAQASHGEIIEGSA